MYNIESIASVYPDTPLVKKCVVPVLNVDIIVTLWIDLAEQMKVRLFVLNKCTLRLLLFEIYIEKDFWFVVCGRMKRTVGFLASLKTDQGPGNLIFENTLTNIGKAYNQSFGQFVPPLDGVYVFSWSVDISVQPFAAIIVVNGKERGRIETPPNIDKECVNFTISSFVIFKLKAGDSVYISLLQGRARKKFSIFSGWLYDESGYSWLIEFFTLLNDTRVYMIT